VLGVETISELRSKAAELRKIAAKLDEAASALAGLGNGNGMHPQSLSVGGQIYEPVDISELSGVDAIERVLEDAGGPMKKEDLLRTLGLRGKAIGENTLQSYLSRDERFYSLGGGRWGLVAKKGVYFK